MKKLLRRFSKVADLSQCASSAGDLRLDFSGKRCAAVPEGHLPVYVGEEMERFVVSAELLNHPIFLELLNRSAAEYGYEQRSGLRIPCQVYIFERVLQTIRVGGGEREMRELLGSISGAL